MERAGRADARITVTSQRDRLLVPQDTTVFDARGRPTRDQHPRDLAAGTRILGGIGQLHFGWFGGWPVRLVYGLLGTALCVVTSSGVTIWMARRRDKGRAVPRWERLWAAVAWGQPLALTLTALAATVLSAGGGTLVALWLTATVLLLLIAGVSRVEGPSVGRWLRCACGLAAMALAMLHAATHPLGMTAATVDGMILLGGGWLSAATLRRPSRAAAA